MDKALQILLASIQAFNTFAPAAGQIIAVFRKPDGEEIPLVQAIDGVVAKDDAGIAKADKYLAENPATE